MVLVAAVAIVIAVATATLRIAQDRVIPGGDRGRARAVVRCRDLSAQRQGRAGVGDDGAVSDGLTRDRSLTVRAESEADGRRKRDGLHVCGQMEVVVALGRGAGERLAGAPNDEHEDGRDRDRGQPQTLISHRLFGRPERPLHSRPHDGCDLTPERSRRPFRSVPYVVCRSRTRATLPAIQAAYSPI